MKATRRDLFKFAAGGAAGMMLTPAPWRLVTDAALWSENWPGIPRPARGETRTRFTHCTLCPAGCAVRARCIGDQPLSLVGLPGQPLCAFGLTGHHLPYHANRIARGDTDAALRAIHSALARRNAKESIAVLDLRPGRTASWTYRRSMAAVPDGIYLAPQSTLPAINLDAVKTIVSLGVPVLDGWGTPWKVLAARRHFRLIQAEPLESHTAVLADEWLPLRQGSEEALAQAIQSVLAGKGAGAGALRTDLPEQRIVSAAHELARGEAVVLAIEESPAVVDLNRRFGGLAIAGRREAPVPARWVAGAAPVTPFDAVPEHSIRALLIDAGVADAYFPWSALQRKLARDATVVVFASSPAGYAAHADFILPAAVYPEADDDVPPPIDSTAACFRLATPLTAAPKSVVSPADFIARLAGLDSGDPLRERADAIHATRRGAILSYPDSRSLPLADLKAEDFWKVLHDGGCWLDEASDEPPPQLRPSTPAVVSMTWEMRAASSPMSPLVTKLYQESNLRVRI